MPSQDRSLITSNHLDSSDGQDTTLDRTSTWKTTGSSRSFDHILSSSFEWEDDSVPCTMTSEDVSSAIKDRITDINSSELQTTHQEINDEVINYLIKL